MSKRRLVHKFEKYVLDENVEVKETVSTTNYPLSSKFIMYRRFNWYE